MGLGSASALAFSELLRVTRRSGKHRCRLLRGYDNPIYQGRARGFTAEACGAPVQSKRARRVLICARAACDREGCRDAEERLDVANEVAVDRATNGALGTGDGERSVDRLRDGGRDEHVARVDMQMQITAVTL